MDDYKKKGMGWIIALLALLPIIGLINWNGPGFLIGTGLAVLSFRAIRIGRETKEYKYLKKKLQKKVLNNGRIDNRTGKK